MALHLTKTKRQDTRHKTQDTRHKTQDSEEKPGFCWTWTPSSKDKLQAAERGLEKTFKDTWIISNGYIKLGRVQIKPQQISQLKEGANYF